MTVVAESYDLLNHSQFPTKCASKSVIFCPLASGSKGNSVYVETPTCRLLFDAGISLKTIQTRLSLLDRSIHDIDAIVISHEHHDHIAGIKTITTKYQIPLIANYATAEAVVESLGGECPKFHIFTTGEPFEWNGLEINAFSVQHDGREPVAFTLSTGRSKIGICTDLGFATSSVKHNLKLCDILYIEANHKPEMVYASARPESYKNRVLSRLGHLSNEASAELIAEVAHPKLQQIYLAHLSSECNTKEIAETTVTDFLKKEGISIPIEIAHQEKISKPTSLEKAG